MKKYLVRKLYISYVTNISRNLILTSNDIGEAIEVSTIEAANNLKKLCEDMDIFNPYEIVCVETNLNPIDAK